jgi:NADPH-dependent 2,4-dienoyl-CoA reductase/sulfur reductase-like enzyme/peroxiredoxin family protein/rhodanese-related sulfurtransferase/TusA-related sulfurtransferase
MKRIVIVGGVAGGASAATRARRLDEDAEIILLERGPYVSFANCGLPYHLSKVIPERDNLLVQTPEGLRARFNIDVRVRHEAVSIDRVKKTLSIRNLDTNEAFSLPYDILVLSPGAEPIRPPIPGLDRPNVFFFRTIPDMDAVMAFLAKGTARHATVVGGGFIGIEVAENLRHRGLAVTLVEMAPQVMPPIDREMASLLHQHMRFHGVDLRLGTKVVSVSGTGTRTSVDFESGSPVETDLVIFAVGVRPENGLAKSAGLTLGPRGGIVVDEAMRTSDPDIFAVGDVIETSHRITGDPTYVPLAGPANRQGRLAMDNALGATKVPYRGTLGTSICKIFDLACGQTGFAEHMLRRQGRAYAKIYTHPASHAGYYPGAFPMTLKLLYDPDTGAILGAQIIGSDGVDKRIDVLATAIAGGMTVEDLAHLELAYAPPFGSAKDPVNMAGMVAQNIRQGLHPAITPDDLALLPKDGYTLLDTRTLEEHQIGHIPGSKLIPIDDMRTRLAEIPKDRPVIVYCQVGLRGYLAARILMQRGYSVRNLVGGFKAWTLFNEEFMASASPTPKALSENFCSTPKQAEAAAASTVELDACGLQCPGPLLRMQQTMATLETGHILKVTATDPGFPADAQAWAHRMGHRVLEIIPDRGRTVVLIEKQAPAQNQTQGTLPAGGPKKVTTVVFSNDLDRAMATFIIANGAAAMGMEVTLFFTFWGLNILRRPDAPPVDKGLMDRMFSKMMPCGPDALGLSKMHFGGMGTAMMRHVMHQKNVTPLSELITSAQEAGVKLVACTMTMDIMGIKKEELIAGVSEGGVAAYLDSAAGSAVNLFI